ncbi:NADH dehydrogenase [ubiquinone] 1 beta subcomplex subunit 9 [Agrilus planipennis]|uniref:NADH dehydrogenase [ubiquinone] 1 beta subcomplex subunit 9 n=1 Tax=Agrilus planipennis TaxID=224129 RepID=A0A1W4X4G0_AGRPL|nr:NADH dehydrogenase [ubiquinone] 1 beta subcomplex subunit 9 [Agrilus planipennis]
MQKALTPELQCIAKSLYEFVKYPTHAKKVCSLYKRVLRDLECSVSERAAFCYRMSQIRQCFEKNRDVDITEGADLLHKGEEELFYNSHPIPRYFQFSPGGVAYEREVQPPDWVLDYWHPIEKEQYPVYFARREVRKKEFIDRWLKKYSTNKNELEK